MSSTIIIKNSATSGSVPSTLIQGEMAINVTNGRLFYGSGSAGTVKEFNLTSSISASYALTSSYTFNTVSASYALTASYALNAGTSTTVSASLFVYTQSAAATTWSINHSLNELYPLVNVYSSSFAIIPSQIKSIDTNNIEIYFAASSSGYATILGKAVFLEGIVTSASYAATASYLEGSISNAVSASYAATASSANTFIVRNSLTASGLNYPSADNGEFSFIQTDGNGNLSLQYVNTLYENIYNGESFILQKGTPVFVSGSVGADSVVYAADAGDPDRMPVIYITADNIDPGDTGRGIALGLITGVDTTGYPGGTEIYTAVGGGWTSSRPSGSAIIQVLGVVTKEGTGGQGVVLNPGPANLPNITSGSVWVGDSNSIPTIIPTASLLVNTASFATTASYVLNAVSSSFATTASYVLNTISASFATTASFTSTASLALRASGSLTGSLFGTASYATQALTASYALNVLTTKSGRILNSSFAGNPRKATVTFSTAFVDANYSVVVTGEDARTWTIESKVSGSFIVSANSNTALAGTTYWIATAYGEN